MCPVCRKSVVDPELYEKQLDEEIAATRMPAEYASLEVLVLCNDCSAKSTVKFHVLGHKCAQCRSYNTSQIKQ
jgi:RING finger/CHY zinc finger protein 1